MRRELGFWMLVYGLLFGAAVLSLLVLLSSDWGVPPAVILAVGIVATIGYMVSVWRAFLR